MAQPVRWPDNARLAMSLVVDVEEVVEHSRWDGDGRPAPEEQPASASTRPLPSSHEYGIRAGGPRVLAVLARHRIRATFTAVPLSLERAPDLARAIVAGGHEVCALDSRGPHQRELSEAAERDLIRNAVSSITTTTGSRPYGWALRQLLTPNTRRLLIEEGFAYHVDDGSDDLPFWSGDGGPPILILPYALDTNDMKFWTAPALTPEQWLAYAIETFDVLYEEGARYPKMMSLGVHLRIIGRPGRIRAFERFVEHVRSRPRVWIATRQEIARWWGSRYPYTETGEAGRRRP